MPPQRAAAAAAAATRAGARTAQTGRPLAQPPPMLVHRKTCARADSLIARERAIAAFCEARARMNRRRRRRRRRFVVSPPPLTAAAVNLGANPRARCARKLSCASRSDDFLRLAACACFARFRHFFCARAVAVCRLPPLPPLEHGKNERRACRRLNFAARSSRRAVAQLSSSRTATRAKTPRRQ